MATFIVTVETDVVVDAERPDIAEDLAVDFIEGLKNTVDCEVDSSIVRDIQKLDDDFVF